MSTQTEAQVPRDETIVVIGDWFIDENWLMAQQQTYSSSHTGNIHYLSKHKKIDKRMISLCGATELLVVLKSYFDKKHEGRYSFLGFGAWNPDDNDILHCTLCSAHIEKMRITPYTVKSLPYVEVEDGERHCPFGTKPCLHQDLHLVNLAKRGNVSTNRIIRVYEGYGGGRPRLLYRFDWQLPLTDTDLDFGKLRDLENRGVTAVIIEDHGKGVISRRSMDELIRVLRPQPGVKWYMRSKLDNPHWLDKFKLEKIEMRLNVIDYKLAQHRHGQRKWWYGPELGRASLELLGDLTGEEVYQHGVKAGPRCLYRSERAAVLFDDNTAIAIAKENIPKQAYCFGLHKPTGARQLINIGRTTVFFISLIAQDLSPELQTLGFETQVANALQKAFEWSKKASYAWNKEEHYFYGNYDEALHNLEQASRAVGTPGSAEENALGAEVSVQEYRKAWEIWNASSTDLGIVPASGDDERGKFHLWRAKGALGDFICVGGPKRDALNNLLARVAEFNQNSRPVHPFNCVLVSRPGWGKSFLARCLARYFDMQFLEFSLSQMATTRDLVDCFDSICSAQNTSEKRVLVFMDEVNCEIAGHSAMSLLLSPIWGGTFTRDGRTYRISPAVWVFASTEPLEDLVKSRKGSDFVSRLNGPVIELDKLSTKHGEFPYESLDRFRRDLAVHPEYVPYKAPEYTTFLNLSGPFRTDQVYLGVSLLNDMWGPISLVEKAVLQCFHDLFLINGFRSLEFFVSKFQNIQRGEVRFSSLPSFDKFPELRRHVVTLPHEYSYGMQLMDSMHDFVEIELEALPSYKPPSRESLDENDRDSQRCTGEVPLASNIEAL